MVFNSPHNNVQGCALRGLAFLAVGPVPHPRVPHPPVGFDNFSKGVTLCFECLIIRNPFSTQRNNTNAIGQRKKGIHLAWIEVGRRLLQKLQGLR